MRIIHCADLHLDSELMSNFTREQAKERKAEIFYTFHRMVEFASENDVKAILVSGDLFDKKNISVKARKYVYEEIKNNPHITFFYLRGNHDTDCFIENLDITPDNLKLFGEKWKSFDIGDCICVSGIELNDENYKSVSSALSLDIDKINIVMLHGQESEYNLKDKAEIIPLRELRGHFIDYLALGHIHSYKCEKLDSRGVYCYPGCLEGRGYDEAGLHGFVLLEIDEERKEIKSSFIPFSKRRIYVEEVDITGCTGISDIEDKITDVIEDNEISARDMVKFIFTGDVLEDEKPDLYMLEQRLYGRLYHFKLLDSTKIKWDMEALMKEKSLKGEFARMVNKADLPDDEKNLIISLGLKALKGEDIEVCS